MDLMLIPSGLMIVIYHALAVVSALSWAFLLLSCFFLNRFLYYPRQEAWGFYFCPGLSGHLLYLLLDITLVLYLFKKEMYMIMINLYLISLSTTVLGAV